MTMLFLVLETDSKKTVKREKDVGKHMIIENRFDNSEHDVIKRK